MEPSSQLAGIPGGIWQAVPVCTCLQPCPHSTSKPVGPILLQMLPHLITAVESQITQCAPRWYALQNSHLVLCIPTAVLHSEGVTIRGAILGTAWHPTTRNICILQLYKAATAKDESSLRHWQGGSVFSVQQP